MSTVGQIERATQKRVIRLFRDTLGYKYLGDWQEHDDSSNIDDKALARFLKRQGKSQTLITRVLHQVTKAAGDQSGSLYDRNKDFYGLLRYGVPVKLDAGEHYQTVPIIDWEHPLANDFAVAEEVTVCGGTPAAYTKRPDVVLYVNGIALGVLELKRSTVSVSEGIRQNLDNQKPLFIERFFTTIQLVMAGNDTEGLRYGVIQTPEKYYQTWKEDSTVDNLLDRHLTQVCEKARFLEMIHDFIVYDAGTKKVCRPNQYFGVKAAQDRIGQREGGIIWHTQGSGKSLTMVWLARWIREHLANSRVLVITDRTELDEQIEKVFTGVRESIYRAASGQDLIDKLNATTPLLMCSLIHKFGGKTEGDDASVQAYISELQQGARFGFKAKGNIVVFVDECHRTQSAKLHKAMKAILPDALFIGFTGTPLLKSDKKTSLEIFGRYIHTYKYDEAVKDKVVLDLRYEARDIDQNITSQTKIDQWFDVKTKGLNDYAQAQLKKKWGTMQKVLSSQSRLEKIVADILLDFEMKDRLQSGHGNALLVSGSIYQACKFYELFASHGFDKCAIVTSYNPSPAAIKGEETGEGPTEKLRQYDIYKKMLTDWFKEDPEIAVNKTEAFEAQVKKKFIDEPGQMKLLIVVDKLLTGFDAPPATYLYIDKSMRDHGLFQAICRVNRLHDESKEYGYVVDYKDLFKSLEDAVADYTSGAFDGFDAEDVAGLLTDRLEKGQERLEEAREAIKALCEPVKQPGDTQDYLRYFCAVDTADKDQLKDNEPKRVALYKLTVSLIRAYADIAGEMEEAGYTPAEVENIKREVAHFEKVRGEVMRGSGDYIDLKLYEPAMRHLIDTYIRADESEKISAFDDMSLIELIVERGVDAIDTLPKGITTNPEAVAETIENNLRRVIIDEQPLNPKHYERMSELLDALIKERREKALEYEKYLAKIVELTKVLRNKNGSSDYPKSLKTQGARALFDNLDKNEPLAVELDAAIMREHPDCWRGSPKKERHLWGVIKDILEDDVLTDKIFDIVKHQSEY